MGGGELFRGFWEGNPSNLRGSVMLNPLFLG